MSDIVAEVHPRPCFDIHIEALPTAEVGAGISGGSRDATVCIAPDATSAAESDTVASLTTIDRITSTRLLDKTFVYTRKAVTKGTSTVVSPETDDGSLPQPLVRKPALG